MKRYTADELLGMTSKRLQDVATELGVKKKFHKSLNKQDRTERILNWYTEQDVRAKAAAVKSGDDVDAMPANAAFEAQCNETDTVSQDITIDHIEAIEPSDNRGGARPGAGRPLGMTAERARMTHVTDTPHRIYKAGFKLLFSIWADRVGCDKIELTEDEAVDIALPWSQIGEYLGWNDYVPEWADIILCGVWTTYNTFKIKARIAREYRDAHKPAVVDSGENREPEIREFALPKPASL